MSAVDVVQRQFDAYNAQDIEAFCATYSDDCIIALYGGEALQAGKSAIRERYTQSWSQYPKNRAWSVHRLVRGDVVIDHEKGERSPEGPFFEAVVIYTVQGDHIVRVDFIQ